MSEFEIMMPIVTVTNFSGSIYPSEDITVARKYLIDYAYKKKSKSKVRLESKLKCGILSSDVIDYFVHEQKDLIIDLASDSEEEDDDPTKLVIINDEKSDAFEMAQETEQNLSPNLKRLKKSISENEAKNVQSDALTSLTPKSQSFLGQIKPSNSGINNNNNNMSPLVSQNVTTLQSLRESSVQPNESGHQLCKDLDLVHKCAEMNMCVKNLGHLIIGEPYQSFSNNLVYVCDVCFSVFRLKDSVKKHIDACNHLSASEYLLEEPKSASTGERTLKYIKNRCSIKGSVEPRETGVFCPKRECNFYFSDCILSCGIHFQYLHNKDEQIYAIAHFKHETNFEISKAHTCPDSKCKIKFKKLSDLILHLNQTKHFPEPAKNEINLFTCSFDDCRFRSVNFSTFKNHAISHSFFNKPSSTLGDDLKVSFKCKTFYSPTSFLHLPQIKQNLPQDNKNECEAIEDLLELNKGHIGYNQLNTRLKARRDELKKASIAKNISL